MSTEFAFQGEHPNFHTLRAGLHVSKREVGRRKEIERFPHLAAALPSGAKRVRFGSDYSEHNGNVTLESLVGKPGNLAFVIIRATGGLGNTKGVWVDRMLPKWIKELRSWAKAGVCMGAVYGFPVDDARVDLDTQLDVFLNTVGDFTGLVPMIDYEMYGPQPAATVDPDGLHYYSDGIGKELGFNYYQMLYSGGFYDEPPPTGPVSDFRAPITTMNAWYRSMQEIENRRQYYYQNVQGSGYWNRFGGQDSDFTQYGIGEGNVDLDACRRSKEWMMKLSEPVAA